jgi:hypothetical protein
MADRGSGDRGSSDSLVRSGNRLPSGITGHTTRCDRSYDRRSLLLTLRRLLQIRIFPFRRPDRFRQPILSNLRKRVA